MLLCLDAEEPKASLPRLNSSFQLQSVLAEVLGHLTFLAGNGLCLLLEVNCTFSYVCIKAFAMKLCSLLLQEKPDVWIEPSKSKIVQIKAAEIITSDK